MDTVLQAVHSTPTKTDWVFDTSGRNWILAPARVMEGGTQANSSYFHDATQTLIEHDQAFCYTALQDFDAILNTLEMAIQ
ncbi:hypothetical protein [Streptomyces sp. enrichment culture]|uniref:hypothetical protein n=1 Tax=Streptomyces sp. enrichment culture TaxID=1795815 RepID=UPI003F57AAC2